MRSSEVLALHAGCCPEPPPSADPDGSATRRHLIRARHYKTAYDDDGNHLSEGTLRPAPWVAVPQVVAAIRILERQAAPTGLLFATNDTSRPGRSVTYATMCRRIDELVTWVNDRTGEVTIPADPHGRIGTRRFRRTLAWHIARQQGGLVALAVQYGHMRTVISESYAARQRDGIHELLDIETARAVADHLADVHDSLQAGGGIGSSRPPTHPCDTPRPSAIRRCNPHPTSSQSPTGRPYVDNLRKPECIPDVQLRPGKALCNPNNSPTRRSGAPSFSSTDANPPVPTSPAPSATPPS